MKAKIELILGTFLTYIIVTAITGPIIIYNGKIGVLRGGTVTFIGDEKINERLLSTYYYFGPSEIGKRTNYVISIPTPEPGCYTFVGMDTRVYYDKGTVTYSFTDGFIS